jgi:hypothetical protein
MYTRIKTCDKCGEVGPCWVFNRFEGSPGICESCVLNVLTGNSYKLNQSEQKNLSALYDLLF